MTEKEFHDKLTELGHLKAPEGTHAWIQFKCSHLGGDVYCKCGHHGWIEGDFAYFYECPSCHNVFVLNGHIRMIELPKGVAEKAREGLCVKTCDMDGSPC